MRGLATTIGRQAHTRPIGCRAAYINFCLLDSKISGNAAVTVMEKAMLTLTELELPDQARAYYQRQIEAVPAKFAVDVKTIIGKGVIPAGYARVDDEADNAAAGLIRKIRCGCTDKWAYGFFGTRCFGDQGNCPKCQYNRFYTIEED